MIEFRKASLSDAQFIFDIRNDPLTRENSRNHDLVPWGGHEKWLAGLLVRPDRKLLIAVFDRSPIGSVRFDFTDNRCDLSWTIAPDQRRQGHGTRMVEMAMPQVKNCNVFADIKDTNTPSQHIAQHNGFIRSDKGQDGFSLWVRSHS